MNIDIIKKNLPLIVLLLVGSVAYIFGAQQANTKQLSELAGKVEVIYDFVERIR